MPKMIGELEEPCIPGMEKYIAKNWTVIWSFLILILQENWERRKGAKINSLGSFSLKEYWLWRAQGWRKGRNRTLLSWWSLILRCRKWLLNYTCVSFYSTQSCWVSEVQKKSGLVPKKALPFEKNVRLLSFCISQRQPTEISQSNNKRTALQEKEQQETADWQEGLSLRKPGMWFILPFTQEIIWVNYQIYKIILCCK